MGCYGDTYATTPNVDKLAAKGVIYTHCWSNAPVCAPARTTLISGLYATSTGGEHMRSMVPYPAGLKMFPQLLREAGYYCTNNVKEDYNLEKPGKVWDDSSAKATWRNRKAGKSREAASGTSRRRVLVDAAGRGIALLGSGTIQRFPSGIPLEPP